MKKLIDGVFKFQSQEFYPRRDFFRELAKGQSPEVLFITCSDSRINPHMLTQTEPGELFVLRNAGNIVPAHGTGSGGEQGSIEYAVSVLGVAHIIICGHSHCGAMKGLLHAEDVKKKLPAVSKWLEHAEATRCVVEHKCGHLSEDDRIQEAAKENILVQLNNLRTLPPVGAKLAQGQLQLHGWVYMIDSGQVLSYDEVSKQFLPLFDEPLPPEALVA